MIKKFSFMGIAAAALLAGGVSAQAAVIDFTALPVGTVGPINGSIGSISYALIPIALISDSLGIPFDLKI